MKKLTGMGFLFPFLCSASRKLNIFSNPGVVILTTDVILLYQYCWVWYTFLLHLFNKINHF